MIPALAAYLTMNFTGASTYTSLSGVKKEMRFALPLEIGAGVVGLMLWLTSRFFAQEPQMERMIYLKNVVTLSLDEEKCSGCGICLDVCPRDVIALSDAGCACIEECDASMESGTCSKLPDRRILRTGGVGCAAAVINTMLERNGAPWCGPANSCAGKESSEKLSCC